MTPPACPALFLLRPSQTPGRTAVRDRHAERDQYGIGFEWVTPHTFRKTVATLIDRPVDSDTAARVLGHSSDAITKEFYIEKNQTTPDVTRILQSFAGTTATTSND